MTDRARNIEIAVAVAIGALWLGAVILLLANGIMDNSLIILFWTGPPGSAALVQLLKKARPSAWPPPSTARQESWVVMFVVDTVAVAASWLALFAILTYAVIGGFPV